MDKGHETGYLECYEPVQGTFTFSSSQGIRKV